MTGEEGLLPVQAAVIKSATMTSTSWATRRGFARSLVIFRCSADMLPPARAPRTPTDKANHNSPPQERRFPSQKIRGHLISRDEKTKTHAAAMGLLQERGFSHAAAWEWLQRHDHSGRSGS